MFSQWKYLLSSQCNFIPRICHNSRVKETLKFLPPLQIFPPCSTLHAPHSLRSTLHAPQHPAERTTHPSIFLAFTHFFRPNISICQISPATVLFQNSQLSAQTDSWDNFCQNLSKSVKVWKLRQTNTDFILMSTHVRDLAWLDLDFECWPVGHRSRLPTNQDTMPHPPWSPCPGQLIYDATLQAGWSREYHHASI